MNLRPSLLCALLCACRPSSDPATPAPALTFSAEPSWPERSTYLGVGQGRVMLTNSRDDTVSLFDLQQVGRPSLPELARVPVGLNPVNIEAPHHAAVAPDGKHWYTALSQFAPGTGSGPHGTHGTGTVDGQLLKLRTSDNRLVSTARVDRNPGDLTISPDGKTVAVSHYDLLRISEAARGVAPDPDARIAFIDAESMTRVAMVRTCPAPHGLAFSSDSKRLYVACYSDEVAVVDVQPDFPVRRIKVALNAGDAFSARYQPYALAVSPTSGDVFVSCFANGEIRVLSGSMLTFDSTRLVAVGGKPLLSAISADGSTLYVPHQGDDRLSVLDTSTGMRKSLFAFSASQCLNIHQVAVLSSSTLAIACEGDHLGPGTLLIVDAVSGEVKSVTAVGSFPDWVGVIRP